VKVVGITDFKDSRIEWLLVEFLIPQYEITHIISFPKFQLRLNLPVEGRAGDRNKLIITYRHLGSSMEMFCSAKRMSSRNFSEGEGM
jgi:hypothetical protein